ncbi:hypothetical protein JB92DRAFT_2946122 [Gautieria morchelliformis]|nr:hypothetical protein JB92DRAFT_2946122 [Gautieria morchelliformis]
MSEYTSPLQSQKSEKLTLGFEYGDQTLKIKTGVNTNFEKIFATVEKYFRVEPNTFRFRTSDDKNVAKDHTPADHEMEDMEIISVFPFHEGGAACK